VILAMEIKPSQLNGFSLDMSLEQLNKPIFLEGKIHQE